MPIFTISYELRGQANGFDYTALSEELRKQRCFRLQTTTWLGSFRNNATQVHNHFRKLMDPADSLIVSELYQHFCYTGGATGVTRWLELNQPTPVPGAKPQDTLAAGLKRAKEAEVARLKAAVLDEPAAETKTAKRTATKRAAKPAAKAPTRKKTKQGQ